MAEDSTKVVKPSHPNSSKYVGWGILIGSASVFLSLLAASFTFPFLQSQRDSLNCDALCYGTMQSFRSGLNVIGTILVGRMSDKFGRLNVLLIGTISSLFTYFINYYASSLLMIWLAMIPSALLNQNYNVLKALFADYSANYGYSESERASVIGRLGMSVGLSFMVGPMLGTTLFSTYHQANIAAFCVTLISGMSILFLPAPNTPQTSKDQDKNIIHQTNDTKQQSIIQKYLINNPLVSFFSMPIAKTLGVQLLLFMRFMMALAFSIFMTIWTVSLKSRFSFGPKDHALFMAWIGLCYAISQGVLAKQFIKLSQTIARRYRKNSERNEENEVDPTPLILICTIALSFGRVFAMYTNKVQVVYGIMATVIVSLGVMNTIIASSCAKLSSSDQVGGLYGIMESVESLAGFVGPTFGGILFATHPFLPLCSVVFLYSLVFMAVFFFFKIHVVIPSLKSSGKSKDVPSENGIQLTVSPLQTAQLRENKQPSDGSVEINSFPENKKNN